MSNIDMIEAACDAQKYDDLAQAAQNDLRRISLIDDTRKAEQYDDKQKSIITNHVALVDQAPDPNCKVEAGIEDVKISFNEYGSIIVGANEEKQIIAYGVVWLTGEQALEAAKFGWKIPCGVNIADIVKVERSSADMAAFQHTIAATRKSGLTATVEGGNLLVKNQQPTIKSIQGSPMQPIKWEYTQIKSYSIDEMFGDSHPNNLKFMGNLGWELMTVTPPQGSTLPWHFIFKRPKASQASQASYGGGSGGGTNSYGAVSRDGKISLADDYSGTWSCEVGGTGGSSASSGAGSGGGNSSRTSWA
jgi:hypothetical protein